MLTPETRHLLTDALRPPDGFGVDLAIATTYTLDLDSLLLAPLAMAAYDTTTTEREDADALVLLESLRRHAERTTVFVQAGGIHVPADYPKLAVFAEDCVVEVRPPAPHRVFHPKIWALRFAAQDGALAHRFVCLSRNLTGDRSWDTVLTLDEVTEGGHAVDPAPLSAFLRDLVAMTERPLSPARQAQLEDLATTFASARLVLPPPFTAGTLLPLGTPSGGAWPLPEVADDVAVVSPFLDAAAVSRLPEARSIHLVSRDVTFERLGKAALAPADATWVLQPLADTSDAADTESDAAVERARDLRRGLHAKVLAWDAGAGGHVLTGSANCTSAAFGGNVEFSVHLQGPAREVGAKALMGDDDGLRRVLVPYAIDSVEGDTDPSEELERELEELHGRIADAGLRLAVTPEDERYALELTVGDIVDPVGTTTFAPIAVAASAAKSLGGDLVWHALGLTALSPYVVVTTRLTRDGVTAERACVLRADLEGAPEDRPSRILRDLLATEADILRYLALLLADPGLDGMLAQLVAAGVGDDDAARAGHGAGFDDVVLLEPLVRAAARGDAALVRVQQLLDELRDPDGNLPTHVSRDFQDLWNVVWSAKEDA